MNSKKRGRLLACLMVLAMLCAMLPTGAPAAEGPAGGTGGAAATVAEAVYSVTADSAITGGSVAADPTSGAPGDTITVTVTPDSGKQLAADSLRYTADSGDYTAIGVTEGVYSFVMPEADVTVTAQFADIQVPEAPDDAIPPVEEAIDEIPALVPMAIVSTDDATVNGGDTITAGGAYHVAPGATGTITINAGLEVTLVGGGVANEPNRELSVDCGEGVILTIRDLFVSNNADINLLNFTGSGNRLLAAGVNVLEGMVYNAKAVLHVGPETQLTIDGAEENGTLYLYKYTAGSGIGGDAYEANGKINFAGGNLFIKGSKTGAVIGNDTCGDTYKEA